MERREKERYRVWFPMTVVTDDGEEGTAITYDVSASGLLMACPGRLAVGAHVTLRFKVSEDEPQEREVAAEIVRVEENAGEEGPWRYRMAVRFDAPQPDLEGVLEANADD
jgi:hypothetical protein